MNETEALRTALGDMVGLIDHLKEYPQCDARRFLFVRDGSEHGTIRDARAALNQSSPGVPRVPRRRSHPRRKAPGDL